MSRITHISRMFSVVGVGAFAFALFFCSFHPPITVQASGGPAHPLHEQSDAQSSQCIDHVSIKSSLRDQGDHGTHVTPFFTVALMPTEIISLPSLSFFQYGAYPAQIAGLSQERIFIRDKNIRT